MSDAVSRTRLLTGALGVSLGVTAVIGAGSKIVPKAHVATFVGLTFLAVTWALVWRGSDESVERHGLGLGGVLLSTDVPTSKVLRDALVALSWALGLSAALFVPYFFLWRLWWHPGHFSLTIDPRDFASDVLGQFLLIALPEEAFYRGYLQTRLDQVWTPRWKVFGACIGPALFVTSAIFAVGHVVTIPVPARLAVFFPALLFGWLRARTGGIGAGIAFHVFCNIYSELLGRGYGVY